MIRSLVKNKLAAGAVLAVFAGGGILAYAFWTGGGSGTGTATAGTPASLTVNQTGAAITGVFPGGPSKSLSGTFDNPNSGPVYVANVTAIVASTSAGGCTASDFAISGTATVNAEVPAGNGKGSWSGLSLSMTDTGSNQDACKGATINIAYTASGS
jgi:hypothetical protein